MTDSNEKLTFIDSFTYIDIKNEILKEFNITEKEFLEFVDLYVITKRVHSF